MSEEAGGAVERGLRPMLRHLYYGHSDKARLFRYGLLAFDVTTVVFFIVSSMIDHDAPYTVVNFIILAVLIADFAARMLIANRPVRFLLTFGSLADLVVIASLVAPLFFENLAFLRIVRMLRLLRSYHVLRELRQEFPAFRQHEEVIQSSVNLAVFVFMITAVVYVLEGHRNPAINNYMDALYFTVTTLTTTGFGDITMQDTLGRFVAVVIMVFGVALFLRLVQTIFRPQKVRYTCPECGLNRHEPDAVHCKHCGHTVKIPTEGEW
ncbi:MAG: ion channel [Hyphomicrobiales bacterium]